MKRSTKHTYLIAIPNKTVHLRISTIKIKNKIYQTIIDSRVYCKKNHAKQNCLARSSHLGNTNRERVISLI